MSERRNYKRYRLWFPVTIELGDAEVWGICRDAGRGGLLVATTQMLVLGGEVKGRFRTSHDAPADRHFDGRVVRCSATDDEMLLAFPFRIAIAFTKPDDELEELLKHVEAV